MAALIDRYSDTEFTQIVMQSYSMSEISRKLGYGSHSGDSLQRIRKRIDKLHISTSHFSNMNKRQIVRNEENIFIKNSTVSQNTLRNWYKKRNYTPYICSICGQPPFWKGKQLTLILDHINGCNNDDRLENLRWVCPNCNQQLPTTNGKNHKKNKKIYYCVDCGIRITRGLRCIGCNAKTKIIPECDMLTNKEELKELIYTKSFVEIGKQFNVSDNTIRKWCKKFNLPYKKSEISKISPDEWVNI